MIVRDRERKERGEKSEGVWEWESSSDCERQREKGEKSERVWKSSSDYERQREKGEEQIETPRRTVRRRSGEGSARVECGLTVGKD